MTSRWASTTTARILGAGRPPAVLPCKLIPPTRITSVQYYPATTFRSAQRQQSRTLITSTTPRVRVPVPPRHERTSTLNTDQPSLLFLRLHLPQKHQSLRKYHFKPSQYDPDGSRLRDAKPLLSQSTLKDVSKSPKTHTIILLSIAGAFIFYFSNLETVPISGRTRFNVYSYESVKKMAEMDYKLLLYQFEQNNIRILPSWDPRTQRVRRVMSKLIPFSGMDSDENGEGEEEWEIYVVDDPRTKNAFVLPGGKVFVFSGILPLCRNDSALAAVLGHEIAHNVAGHVGERLSSSIGTNILLYTSMILAGAFGVGPLLMHFIGSRILGLTFENPMSRKQESEADYIGLMIMAEACYDPREAVGFWVRMEQANSDGGIPEWASTHPSNENRVKKIQEWLPKALEKRAESDCHSTASFADLFKRALREGFIIVD